MSDTIRLEVGGMTCDGCSSRVRDALQAVSGVSSAEVSYEQGSAVISHSGASRENLSSAVRAIGYTVDGLGESSIGAMEAYGDSPHTIPSGA